MCFMVMGMVTSFSEINNYAIVNYDYDHNVVNNLIASAMAKGKGKGKVRVCLARI